MFSFLTIVSAIGTFLLLPSLAPPENTNDHRETPHTQFCFEMRLNRTDTKASVETKASDKKPATDAKNSEAMVPPKTEIPVLIAAPTVSTLDGGTASISTTGGEPSYSISLSPALEKSGRDTSDKNAANSDKAQFVQVQWIVRLTGKGLPGATSVTIAGASRLTVDKEESLADLNLRDPRTGQSSVYQLSVKTTIADGSTKISPPSVP